MAAFEGRLTWIDGESLIQGKKRFIEWLSQYPEETWFSFLVVPEGESNRSPQQKLYWKWVDLMALEFGWDNSISLHEFFKKIYNSGNSTRTLGVKEWSTYMTKIQAFATEHNFILPQGDGT